MTITVRYSSIGQDAQADGYHIEVVEAFGDFFWVVMHGDRELGAHDDPRDAEEHVAMARQHDAEERALERAEAAMERGF